MARKFSFPEVQTLAIDGTAFVAGARSEVVRKVNLYAKRVGRAYKVADLGSNTVAVIRLPDPVKEEA